MTGETHNLSSLHTILSTGSPLKPLSYEFVYKHIKKDLLLGSITGIYIDFVKSFQPLLLLEQVFIFIVKIDFANSANLC